MRHSTRSNICAGTLRTISEASIRHASLTRNPPAMAPSTHSPLTPLNPVNPANPVQTPNPNTPKHSNSPSEHNHPQSPPNLFAAPNPQRMSTTPSNDVPNLAEAIAMLANNLSSPKKSSPRTKVCEPDTFDGSDSRKLQPFLVQCNLNFRDRPDAFSSDSAKVTYVLSYLKGTPLDWFEPTLSSDIDPSWIDDYPEFVSELKDNFGPHDPVGKAEADLETLRMRDNQREIKYMDD